MRKPRDQAEKRDQADGRLNAQNLFWSWYRPRNFGDWVTPYLFEKLTGREAVHCPAKHLRLGATTVFGAGSILRHISVADVAIVWGSGIIDGQDCFERPLRTVSVRGPLTRARMHDLGFDCPAVFGDPALALPHVYRPDVPVTYEVGLVPHFVELEKFRHMALPKGWRVIDVTQGMEKVVDAITSCRQTLSSSLHGIIVSHAYGVPSAWIASDEPLHGDGVKFRDYFASVSIAGDFGPSRWVDVFSTGGKAIQTMLPDVSAVQADILASCPFLSEVERAA